MTYLTVQLNSLNNELVNYSPSPINIHRLGRGSRSRSGTIGTTFLTGSALSVAGSSFGVSAFFPSPFQPFLCRLFLSQPSLSPLSLALFPQRSSLHPKIELAPHGQQSRRARQSSPAWNSRCTLGPADGEFAHMRRNWRKGEKSLDHDSEMVVR